MSLLKERNVRLKYLSEDEEDALLSACSTHLRPMVLLGLNTGMRCGEVLALRWDHVDLDGGLILLQETKNGKRREIPINKTVRVTLERLPRHIRSPYVFCKASGHRYGSIAVGFRGARRRAGLSHEVIFHTLRHTFASRLVMGGVDLVTIKELLGHSSLAMVLRYAHLNPEHKRKAVGILDRAITSASDTDRQPGRAHA